MMPKARLVDHESDQQLNDRSSPQPKKARRTRKEYGTPKVLKIDNSSRGDSRRTALDLCFSPPRLYELINRLLGDFA